MLAIRSFGTTDTGLQRTHNEDSFDADDSAQLYVVADGMGGHNHGEIASRLAVASMREFLADASLLGPPGSWCVRQLQGAPAPTVVAPAEVAPAVTDGNGALRPHTTRLKRSVEVAHAQIMAAMERDVALLGMGTTVVSALLQEQTLAIAHVGDSRAYRRRNGQLELLTHDHTWVWEHTWVYEQMIAGYLSEEEAQTHPLKSVVTRALGGDGDFASIGNHVATLIGQVAEAETEKPEDLSSNVELVTDG